MKVIATGYFQLNHELNPVCGVELNFCATLSIVLGLLEPIHLYVCVSGATERFHWNIVYLRRYPTPRSLAAINDECQLCSVFNTAEIYRHSKIFLNRSLIVDLELQAEPKLQNESTG